MSQEFSPKVSRSHLAYEKKIGRFGPHMIVAPKVGLLRSMYSTVCNSRDSKSHPDNFN